MKIHKFPVCYELGTMHTCIPLQLHLCDGYYYYKTEGKLGAKEFRLSRDLSSNSQDPKPGSLNYFTLLV